MSDNLDQVISEMKKIEGPMARVMQEIFEDTKRRYESKDQRSETMTTYSTITAMAKAKAEPDTLFRSDEYDTTVVYHTTPFPRWVFTEPDKEWWYVRDMELQKELPEIQEGDWFKTNERYLKITGVEDYRIAYRKLEGIDGHFAGTMPSVGNYVIKNAEKITDERALMFLNAGRKPDDWKDGDIATDGVSLFTIGHDWHEDSAREQQFMPVCFAESRVDRGDTP